MNDDPEIPKASKDTLRKILKHLIFKFVARSRKSTLIDRNDIITWRQHYLRSICQFRQEGRHIYYQDETWVNAGNGIYRYTFYIKFNSNIECSCTIFILRSYCKKNLGGQESQIISASVFGGTDHWIKKSIWKRQTSHN